MTVSDQSLQFIECGVASRTLESQTESGDRHVIQTFPGGVLVAAVDGLGHGREAAAAAGIAVATLAAHAHESLTELVMRCHRELTRTRGVVMTLASFDALVGTMTWLAVGNIEGVLLRADPNAVPNREMVLLRSGMVGYQLPLLRASIITVTRGDTLILATDGIRSGFTQKLTLSHPPQQIADHILTQYGKDTDDALVLVARYLGGAS